MTELQEVLRFQSLYQERVWGGRALATALGRSLPAGHPIGESWEIVDRPEAQSVVVGGRWAGQTLRAILASHSAAIMGPAWPAKKPFPILIKWLDCRERLSLQVHPPAAIAPEMKGEPKTENWFIAESSPGAQLIVGLKRGVTRAQFEQAIAAGTLEECVHRFPVQAGDSILVQSGRVHAIDGGNLILEIQQNSDTTYRVYDWGRMGLDGKPRQMHVAESLRSIDWGDFEPSPERATATSGVIADCAEFRIRRAILGQGERMEFAADVQPRLISVVTGEVFAVAAGSSQRTPSSSVSLRRGDNVLLPYAGAFSLAATTPAVLLVTESFTG
jgi:mannose-6-phosphate isomerase